MRKLILKGALGALLLLPISISAVPEVQKTSPLLAQEISCMEQNLYHEARGESIKGIKAVASVTINRKKSGKFPNTVCGVVKQPGQFSWVKQKGFRKIPIPNYIKQIAYDSVTSKHWKDVTNGALYFHNDEVEKFNRKLKVKIGSHYFYG